MAAWRRAIELSLGDADSAKLRSITHSRTEPASRVERARILLAYREDPSFFAVGRRLGLHHQTVQRCVERAVAEGPMAALDDRPRPGKEPGMAEVLCVYRKVKLLKTASRKKPSDAVAVPWHALVKDRHRSREFIEFLKLLDTAYPPHTAIHLILDNHSAHISKDTRAWLADQPAGRFKFTFTPKHGSWLNLVEGFFSKLARSVLRHIRVSSKQELKDRLMAAMDFFNRDPVVHTWTYKLDKAA